MLQRMRIVLVPLGETRISFPHQACARAVDLHRGVELDERSIDAMAKELRTQIPFLLPVLVGSVVIHRRMCRLAVFRLGSTSGFVLFSCGWADCKTS